MEYLYYINNIYIIYCIQMAKRKDWERVKWKTFWYLTVIDDSPITNWKQAVLVRCKCGKEKYVSLSNLLSTKSNRTVSCWCMKWQLISEHRTVHWMRWTSWMYSTFRCIKSRCGRKNNKDYERYWWRWIKVLRKDFVEFYNDMYESYQEHVEKYWKDNTTIDRIDVNGDYCKENCRRATKKEQCNNRRNNLIIEYKWNKYTLQQLSELTWVNRSTISKHYKKWEHIEDIINKYKKYETQVERTSRKTMYITQDQENDIL